MRRSYSSRLRWLLTPCLAFLFVGCSLFEKHEPTWQEWADREPSAVTQNHWHLGSVDSRIIYALTGYRAEDWNSYRDFQYAQKQDINHTLRRHGLNRNSVSPLQRPDPTYGQERPPHSIWPRPDNYFHLTSLVIGGVFSASSAGVFLPIPIDSLIATLEPGGFQEFSDGVHGQKEAPLSRHTRHNPPPTSEFRLKNN